MGSGPYSYGGNRRLCHVVAAVRHWNVATHVNNMVQTPMPIADIVESETSQEFYMKFRAVFLTILAIIHRRAVSLRRARQRRCQFLPVTDLRRPYFGGILCVSHAVRQKGTFSKAGAQRHAGEYDDARLEIWLGRHPKKTIDGGGRQTPNLEISRLYLAPSSAGNPRSPSLVDGMA